MKRRTLLATTALGALAGLIGSAVGEVTPAAADPGAGNGLTGTTLDKTVQKKGTSGFLGLEKGLGEGFTLRNDFHVLVRQPTLSLASFAQMTDLHIVDDQSPARVEWLDDRVDFGTGSAYRPHESLSTQIVEAMVKGIRKAGRGPRTGRPLQFTVVTGDVVDNAQYNETRWYIDLLDGQADIIPNSGRSADDSFSTAGLGLDPRFYRPQDKGAESAANRLSNYYQAGWPEIPGLIDGARRPFRSTGLGMPWYTAFGNHDAFIQGNVDPDFEPFFLNIGEKMRDFAVGDRKVSFFQRSFPQKPVDDWSSGDWKDLINALVDGPNLEVIVAADSNRRILRKRDFVDEHFRTIGSPVGHGFVRDEHARTYYEIPTPTSSLVKYLVADTMQPGSDIGADGDISIEQFSYLQERLIAYSKNYWNIEYRADPFTGQFTDGPYYVRVSNPSATDRLIVLFGHHDLGSMRSDRLSQLLMRFQNVIAYVNGHTHRNRIITRPNLNGGGYWDINTASHIDWPVQSRLVEISASRDTVSIHTTMVDIDAPELVVGDTSSPTALASLGRQLAANDPQELLEARSGGVADRNAHLLLNSPFALPHAVRRGPSIALAGNADGLLELVACDTAGNLLVNRQVTPGGSWSSFTTIGSGAMSVAAELSYDSKMWMFHIDQQGALFLRGQNAANGSWGSASQLSGGLFAMSMARNKDGRIEIFGTNHLNQIFRRATLSGASFTGWTDWIQLDGEAMDLAAEKDNSGRVHVFAICPNGSVVVRWQSSPGGSLTNWIAFSASPLPAVTSIAAARHNDGRLEVFVTDDSGLVWSRWQTAPDSNWSDWAILGGRMTYLAAHSNVGTKGMNLIGVDRDGEVWDRKIASGSWQPWGRILFGSLRLRPGLPSTVADFAAGTNPLPPPPPPPSRSVPDVIGMGRTTAKTLLEQAGWVVTVSSRSTADPAQAFMVVEQSPRGGVVAPIGSTVNISYGVLSTDGDGNL